MKSLHRFSNEASIGGKKPVGHMDQRNIDFYDVLARDGAGLIVVASAPLPPRSARRVPHRQGRLYPRFCRVGPGRSTGMDVPRSSSYSTFRPMQPPFLPGEPAAASSLPKNEPARPQFAKARELTVPEIGDIVNEFAGAAQRIRAAGFDGIGLQRRHEPPPQQLPVPSLEQAAGCLRLRQSRGQGQDRRRDHTRGQEAVRPGLHGHFPHQRRGAGLKNGITVEQSSGIARILQSAGADAIGVRGEFYSRPQDDALRDSTHFPDAYFYPDSSEPLDGALD